MNVDLECEQRQTDETRGRGEEDWDGQTLCLKRLGSLLSLRLRSMKKCVARAVSSGGMSHTMRKESQVTSQIWMLHGVASGASISVICH